MSNAGGIAEKWLINAYINHRKGLIGPAEECERHARAHPDFTRQTFAEYLRKLAGYYERTGQQAQAEICLDRLG